MGLGLLAAMLPLAAAARSLQGTNNVASGGLLNTVQLSASGRTSSYELGCSTPVTVDPYVQVWGGPVYSARVVLSIYQGGQLGQDRLTVVPHAWSTAALPCPGLRVTSFALEEFGLIFSPATDQAYADPAVVQDCMRRVVYSNVQGEHSVPA